MAPRSYSLSSAATILRKIAKDVTEDRGLGVALWEAQVKNDVIAITRVICVTALVAYGFAEWQLVALEGRQDAFLGARAAVMLLVASSLFWMPMVLERMRSPLPAALFWGAIPLANAALDRASDGQLVDVLWSLIPGYLAILVVGFSFGSIGLAAALLVYCIGAAALVHDMPRGIELQVLFLLMMLSTGAFLAHLYRRSARAHHQITALQAGRLRNLARVLPEPIVAAVHDEAELREMMRPRLRDVIAIRLDIRASTTLLKHVAAVGYAEIVRPLTTNLYQHARSVDAFAKFEGDGLLVVFGAFDDAPCSAELASRAIDLMHHADHTASRINASLTRRGLPPLYVGMAADCGSVVAGTVAGLEAELLFDVIGEPINRASRLESFTKTLLAASPAPRNVALVSDALAQRFPADTGLRRVALAGEVRDFESEPAAWELKLDEDTVPVRWTRSTARISGGFDEALRSGAFKPPPLKVEGVASD